MLYLVIQNKRNHMFDAWEFPEKCKKCGRYDNNDPKEPVTILDVSSKLCEFCFDEIEDDKETHE